MPFMTLLLVRSLGMIQKATLKSLDTEDTEDTEDSKVYAAL
jgi:hypothetical protein